MNEVLTLIDITKPEKISPLYDRATYPQVSDLRFEELKVAFMQYDTDKSGKIKTAGETRVSDKNSDTGPVEA